MRHSMQSWEIRKNWNTLEGMRDRQKKKYRSKVEEAIDQQRAALGMKWQDVREAADDGGRPMAIETLRRLRLYGTDAVDTLSVARVERALHLPQGTLRRFESGEIPLPANDTGTAAEPTHKPGSVSSPRMFDDYEQSVYEDPDLPEDKKIDLIANYRVRKTLAERAAAEKDEATDPKFHQGRGFAS